MAGSNLRDVDVAIRVQCPADIGALHADEKRLKQILFHLLSNALRFTEKGDEIIVGAARLEGEVQIWVADTGQGVPFDEQASAFDNFVSGDRRGAGLGLALVRSFVRMHGGWVALESAPGEGAKITCHLPDPSAVPLYDDTRAFA
jgi:signal transduction histidine kinase